MNLELSMSFLLLVLNGVQCYSSALSCGTDKDCRGLKRQYCIKRPGQYYGVCLYEGDLRPKEPCNPNLKSGNKQYPMFPLDCIPDYCDHDLQCPKGYKCINNKCKRYYYKRSFLDEESPSKSQEKQSDDIGIGLKRGGYWCRDDSQCPGSYCIKLPGNLIGVCAAPGSNPPICPPWMMNMKGSVYCIKPPKECQPWEVYCNRPKDPVRPTLKSGRIK